MCVCDCVGVGVIVWVGVGVIKWVRKGVCEWGKGECVCMGAIVCVGVSVWVRRARGSLDGWCMFVWCGQGVSYAGWDWIYMYVGEHF